MGNRKSRKTPIHPSIKETLGYEKSQPDEEVFADWKERTTRVCKPCWELKYCPYGPLVEQLPLLPQLRSDVEEHNRYLERCLATNVSGTITPLTAELKELYREWLSDDQTLLHQALVEHRGKRAFSNLKEGEAAEDRLAQIGGALPPVHLYRAPFDILG